MFQSQFGAFVLYTVFSCAAKLTSLFTSSFWLDWLNRSFVHCFGHLYYPSHLLIDHPPFFCKNLCLVLQNLWGLDLETNGNEKPSAQHEMDIQLYIKPISWGNPQPNNRFFLPFLGGKPRHFLLLESRMRMERPAAKCVPPVASAAVGLGFIDRTMGNKLYS